MVLTIPLLFIKRLISEGMMNVVMKINAMMSHFVGAGIIIEKYAFRCKRIIYA
jgi:hypothetical protein